MTTISANTSMLLSIPDSQSASQRKKNNARQFINQRLFDLEREIAEKCKNFGQQIILEPVRPQRKFTREFFDYSQPLTPIQKKKMSIGKLFEIQIIDGNTTCETSQTFQNTQSRQASLFESIFTQQTDLIKINSISPQAILEEKPILELNIQRYSNSLSDKSDNPNSHQEQKKKLQEQAEKAQIALQKIEEQIKSLESKTNLSDVTAKKTKKLIAQNNSLESFGISTDFTLTNLQQLQTKVKHYQQKVYVYQKIFIRIYNLIHENPMTQQQPHIVNQIQTRKYIRVEDDLRELFEKLRIFQLDISKYNQIKRNMEKEINIYDSQINEMMTKIKNLQQVEKSLTSTKTVRCQFQLQNSKNGNKLDISSVDKNSILAKKIKQLQNIYDLKLKTKYHQISQIKLQQQSLISQILQSQHSSNQRKRVQIINQTVEIQNPNECNQYVKRSFTRKVKRTKNVEVMYCNYPQHHIPKEQKHIIASQIINEKTFANL